MPFGADSDVVRPDTFRLSTDRQLANANCLVGYTDQCTLLKVVGEAAQDVIQEPLDIVCPHVCKSERDYAGKAVSVQCYDASKIEVMGQDHSALGKCFGDNLGIRQPLEFLVT